MEGNKIYDSRKKRYKSYNPFRISIHDPMSVADLNQGANVEPGYITTFLITPSQIVTSASAKDLPIEKRQCLFRNEYNNLTLFNYYTQANCFFECHLQTAYDICQCVPWDFPQLNSTWEVCDRVARECFRTQMRNTKLDHMCNCPLDCATTRYTLVPYSTILNAEALCNSNKAHMNMMGDYYYRNPAYFFSKNERVMNNEDNLQDSTRYACIKRSKSLAIVKFEIADQIITRIRKTKRMTFADILANIGTYSTSTICNCYFDFKFICLDLQEELWDCSLESVF